MDKRSGSPKIHVVSGFVLLEGVDAVIVAGVIVDSDDNTGVLLRLSTPFLSFELSMPPSNDDYIATTSTRSFVARSAILHSSDRVDLRGRNWIGAHAQIHPGSVRLGRFASLGANVNIQPPVDVPVVTIGAYTRLEAKVSSEAASIGSYCWIGEGVVLGPRVIVKDCVVIAPGTVVPSDTVVPPFTRVDEDGSVELSPSTWHPMQEEATKLYRDFAERYGPTEG